MPVANSKSAAFSQPQRFPDWIGPLLRLQAAEVMLYTVDRVNSSPDGTVLPPGVRMGAYILDDCDKDTYGLQQAVEFIKGDECMNVAIRYLHRLTGRAGSALCYCLRRIRS